MTEPTMADDIFRNREIIMRAAQNEAKSFPKLTSNGNQTLKLFSRINLSKKDILSVDKADLESLLISKFNQLLTEEQENDLEYADSMEKLQRLTKSAIDDDETEYNIKTYLKRKSRLDSTPGEVPNSSNNTAQNSVMWQKWSGNVSGSVPAEVRRFVKLDEVDDEDDDTGVETISVPFKSQLWQQITRSATQNRPLSSTAAGMQYSVRFSDDSSQQQLPQQGEANHGGSTGRTTQGDVDQVDMPPIKRHCASNRRYSTLPTVHFLLSIPALQHLSLDSIHRLAGLAVAESCDREQIILRQGQNMSCLFIVRRGQVKVTRATSQSPYVAEEVQTLYGGDCFGYDLDAQPPQPTDHSTNNGSNYSDSGDDDEDDSKLAANPSSYTYTALTDSTELLVFNILDVLGVLSQDTRFARSLPAKMALLSQSNAYPRGADYVSLHCYSELMRDVLQAVPYTVSENANIRSSSGVPNSAAFNAECLQKIAFLCGPELDLEEVVDELLALCKAVLQVDRVSLYVVDKLLNTMVLYTAQSQLGGGAGASTITATAGVRMPLKGLASHVATSNAMLNIADCYSHRLFDPTMDIRTGYRTHQMLCAPIRDDARNANSNVIAVLQCINTRDKQSFNHCHEIVANMICSLVGTKHRTIKLRSSLNAFKSSLKLKETVRFTLTSILTDKPHRHIKVSVRLFVGNAASPKQIGRTFTTDLLSTRPVSDDDHSENCLKQCEVNAVVDFDANVHYSQLDSSARVIIQLYSKGNTPAGWCGIDLFQFNRVLRSNEMTATMWDGAYPSTNAAPGAVTSVSYLPHGLEGFECIKSTYDGMVAHSDAGSSNNSSSMYRSTSSMAMHRESDTQANYNTATLQMSDTDVNVLFEPAETAIRFSFPGVTAGNSSSSPPAAPLPPGVRALDWYLGHMQDGERRKVTTWLEHTGVVDPTQIDHEAAMLLWRVRHAASKERPRSLVLLLCCVDFSNMSMVADAYRLLSTCSTPRYHDAVQLLDHRFSDPKIRSYAVAVLRTISDAQLTHILPSLVYMLRYEQYADNALSRFLVTRGVSSPYGVGQQLLRHLQNTHETNAIFNNHCNVVSAQLLRLLTDEERVRITHGLFMTDLLLSSFDKVRSAQALSSPASSSKRTATSSSESAARLKDTLTMLAQEVSSHAERIPSEFVLPVPCFMATKSTQTTTAPAVVYSGIANYFTVGEAMKQSFSCALRSDSSPDTRHVVMLSRDLDHRVETAYSQLTHALDAIWGCEAAATGFTPLDSLTATTYNSFCLRDCAVDNAVSVPMVVELPQGSQSLQSVIVKALHAEFMAAKEAAAAATAKRGRKPDGGPKKIPDSLLEEYLRGVGEGGAAVDGRAYGLARSTFIRSLAAYLVSTHVLGVRAVTVSNMAVTKRGDLYVKTPSYVLGLENCNVPKKQRAHDKNPSTPYFYLPCFAKMLGDVGSQEQREFDNLVAAAFTAARRNATHLAYTVTTMCRQLAVPDEVLRDSLTKLHENLMLHLNDSDALVELRVLFARGLRADYQLNVNFG